MIYTNLTNRAMKIAYDAHEGQVDKGGIPYIFHPYHLAEQMDNETRTCIALLHDVVEDTPVTLEELAGQFPGEVIEALALLTHEDGTDYHDYVRGVCANLDASLVKLADLIHNTTPERLSGTDAAAAAAAAKRWEQKYRPALETVTRAITQQTKDVPGREAEWELMQRLCSEAGCAINGMPMSER